VKRIDISHTLTVTQINASVPYELDNVFNMRYLKLLIGELIQEIEDVYNILYAILTTNVNKRRNTIEGW